MEPIFIFVTVAVTIALLLLLYVLTPRSNLPFGPYGFSLPQAPPHPPAASAPTLDGQEPPSAS
jgi:hypothetical protein